MVEQLEILKCPFACSVGSDPDNHAAAAVRRGPLTVVSDLECFPKRVEVHGALATASTEHGK